MHYAKFSEFLFGYIKPANSGNRNENLTIRFFLGYWRKIFGLKFEINTNDQKFFTHSKTFFLQQTMKINLE